MAMNMTYKIEESVKENILKFQKTNGEVPMGTYTIYYKDNEHRNFIANIEYLGPLVISITEYSKKMRVLLRSVVGLREFLMFSEHIPFYADKYKFSLKVGIETYFKEMFFNSTNSSYIDETYKEKSSFLFKTFSRFFNDFKALESGKKDNNSDTASISTSYVYSKESYENIKNHIISKKNEFTYKKIVSLVKELDKKFINCLTEWDEGKKHSHLVVDVLIDKNVINSHIFSLLGYKIEKEEFILMKSEKRKYRNFEKELKEYKFKHKNSQDGKFWAVKEFITTEFNYFKVLHNGYKDFVDPLWSVEGFYSSVDRETCINILFGAFNQVYEFEKKFIRSLFSRLKNENYSILSVFENEKDVIAVLGELNIFTDEKVSEDAFKLKLDEIIDIIFETIDEFFSDPKAYIKLFIEYNIILKMINEKKQVKFLKHILAPKNFENKIQSILIEPIQRVVRYRLLMENILQFMDIYSEGVIKAKPVILKMKFFISHLNNERANFESITSSFILKETVLDCPAEAVDQRRRVLGQLDCVSNEKSLNISLFLYTDSLLITQRRGKPEDISQMCTRDKKHRFKFIRFEKLENIIVLNKRKNNFKINVIEPSETNEYVNIHLGCMNDQEVRNVESYSLTAGTPEMKNKFITKLLHTQNNLKILQSKGDLYYKEGNVKTYFHVFDFRDFTNVDRKTNILLNFTNEEFFKDKILNEKEDFIYGEISLKEKCNLRFYSSKNVEFYNENELTLEDLKSKFSEFLKSSFDTHSSLPPMKNSDIYFEKEEALGFFDEANKGEDLEHLNFYDSFKSMDQKIERLKIIFSFVEKKIIGANNIKSTTQSKNIFPFNTQIFEIKLNECVINPETLYQKDISNDVKKVLSVLMKSKSIKEEQLQKIDLEQLTSMIMVLFNESIYDMFTYESLLEFYSCMLAKNLNDVKFFISNMKYYDKALFLAYFQHFSKIKIHFSSIPGFKMFTNLFIDFDITTITNFIEQLLDYRWE